MFKIQRKEVKKVILNIRQNIFCENSESIDHMVVIKKVYETQFVPRIGEKIYNHMWKDDEGTSIADICYDIDSKTCDIALEKLVVDNTKEEIVYLAKLHSWEILL